MYVLNSPKLAGLRVMIVESEIAVIDVLERRIAASGGLIVCYASCVAKAMAGIAEGIQVDCIVIDAATATAWSKPFAYLAAVLRIQVAYFSGDDRWYESD